MIPLLLIAQYSAPLAFTATGETIGQKSGVLNIGLEGLMLSAAFTGVVVSAYAQQWFGPETGQALGPWLGLLAGRVELGVEFGLLIFRQREFLTHGGDQVRMQQTVFQPVLDGGGWQAGGD